MPPTAAINSHPRTNVNKVQSQDGSYASATVADLASTAAFRNLPRRVL